MEYMVFGDFRAFPFFYRLVVEFYGVPEGWEAFRKLPGDSSSNLGPYEATWTQYVLSVMICDATPSIDFLVFDAEVASGHGTISKDADRISAHDSRFNVQLCLI